MDEHLGYEKNSVLGNNSGNSRNGYGKKTIISDYGECEISVPRDRNGECEPKVIEKRQTRLCSEFSVNARFHGKTVHILRSSEPEAEAEPPPMAARSVLDRLA